MSNMYSFIDQTENFVRGKCPHGCDYCYIKRMSHQYKREQRPLYFEDFLLKKNLGSGKKIFVGSSCDMWADEVPDVWIWTVLRRLKQFPDNEYLFQTKNPKRYLNFMEDLPPLCELGTTIETNRIYPCMGNTLSPEERSEYMQKIKGDIKTFITVEPILDFDLDAFIGLLVTTEANTMNFGADSKCNKLPEPSRLKLEMLIELLTPYTKIHLKENLKRLLPESELYMVEKQRKKGVADHA